MGAPQYSSDDFLRALQALMPPGRAWPRDASTVQSKVLAGLAQVYAAQTARSNNLLVDAFPATTQELLPEWEATLGLPSLAAGPNPTLQARQTLVMVRLIGSLGVSVAGLASYAAKLGYNVTIGTLSPFRCGQSGSGQPVGGLERMFGLLVTASKTSSMPFGVYGPAVLQDELTRILAPTTVLVLKFT